MSSRNAEPSQVVLGVDVGTSSLKAGLFTPRGERLAFARLAYPLSSPQEGAMEQDPLDWWHALATASRQLMAEAPAGARLLALSIGGQAPTLVAVDADLQPTHPAITWLDQRPAAGMERLYAAIGQPVPVWGSWPAQAAWFAGHRSSALSHTRWLLGCPDYLTVRLTGRPASMLETPLAELEATGVDLRLVPPAWVPGEVVGHITRTAAGFTGLPAGTPVVGGYVDGVLGVLGSGVRRPGDACINCGTSGTCTVVCLPPLGWPIFGLNLAGTATNTSGKALDWFMESIAAPGASYASLIDQAASVPPGSDGLIFLPHLAGERAVQRDRLSGGGAWVGLTLGHDRRHLVRSVLEGVAFGFRVMQAAVEALGAEVGDVRCVGGQARSPFWNQMKADVLNRRVLVPDSVEAAVVGGAIFAALGVGAFASLEQAIVAMVHITREFHPDAGRVAVYQRQFERFSELNQTHQ